MQLTLRRIAWCALVAAATGGAAPPTVPTSYRGVWARNGQCQTAGARLVLRDTTAQLGRGAPMPVILFPHDSPAGQDALHWAGEGNVDNFVLLTHPEAIIHNGQGYGMGEPELYRRCGP